MRIAYPFAVVILLLSSCGTQSRLDTSSDEAFDSSLVGVKASLSHAEKEELAGLMAQLANREKLKEAAGVLQGKPVKTLGRAETFRPLNGMSGVEIIAYCRANSGPAPVAAAHAPPAPQPSASQTAAPQSAAPPASK